MATLVTKEVNRNINYQWLTLLFAGTVFTSMGIWMFVSPVESYLALSLVFAIGILAAGIFEMAFSITYWKTLLTWGWNLAFGFVDLCIGGYLLFYPFITMSLLPYVVGFWILVRGFLTIGSALNMRSQKDIGWRWLLFAGIIITILSLAILSHPVLGIVGIISYTGLSFIGFGIYHIYLSLAVKKTEKKLLLSEYFDQPQQVH